MPSNNSPGRKAQRRAEALARFTVKSGDANDKTYAKYVERKEAEKQSLKKVR